MIETLFLAGAILCASVSLAVIVTTADTVGEWFHDYSQQRQLRTSNRELKLEIDKLQGELQLWKKACENLHKDVNKNEAET